MEALEGEWQSLPRQPVGWKLAELGSNKLVGASNLRKKEEEEKKKKLQAAGSCL